jgi:RNA polymerase sigma-70 factor (ECF subfamily)
VAASPEVPAPAVASEPIGTSVPRSRPLPDAEFDSAIDEAIVGEVLADLPEAQPSRLVHATDFSSLYIRHRSGLAAHARKFLRDGRDVDEVVQETFLRLFLAISEIETELQAIAFARRTLTNLCIDRYRADRRRPTLVALDHSPVAELADEDLRPDPVLQAEDAAIVRDALARLSPLHRAALVKREIEEKTLPQIAAELGVAEESVKHLLFRARRALRRLLVGTSVQPGVDLTVAEMVGIANRRVARSLVQASNVFAVLVVGAVVAAVGVRPLIDRGASFSAPSGAAAGQVAQRAAGPASTRTAGRTTGAQRRAHRVVSHRLSATTAPASTAPRPVPAAPPVGRHSPVKTASPRNGPSGIHHGTGTATPAPRAHLMLSGPLEVTGSPRIVAARSVVSPGGGALAVSSFVAPTTAGTFELNQTLTTRPGTGSSASVIPTFVVGNTVERPTLTGSTATVGSDAAGDVTVDLVAGAQPDPADGRFPLSSLSAQLVLTPDLSRVVSETVALAAVPVAAPSQPVAAQPGGCPAAGQPAVPAGGGCTVSDTSGGEPAPNGTASADVVENPRHV